MIWVIFWAILYYLWWLFAVVRDNQVVYHIYSTFLVKNAKCMNFENGVSKLSATTVTIHNILSRT